MAVTTRTAAVRRPWLPAWRPRAVAGAASTDRQAPPPPQQQAPSSAIRPLPKVVLKGGKAKFFTDQQSPMVFSGAVDRVVGRPGPKTGDCVLVCDGAERVLGWGVFNRDSMFRVRIMQLAGEWQGQAAQEQQVAPDLPALLQARLEHAMALRQALGLPSPGHTTVYRLVNSEGDRLSGLVVDALGPDHAVVSSSAAWVELQRGAIEAWLRDTIGAQHVVWRQDARMLLEEGVAPASAGAEEAAEEGEGNEESMGVEQVEGTGIASSEQAQASVGSSTGGGGGGSQEALGSEAVVLLEHGVRYMASPLGQKTGFYADQRDSRLLVRQLAARLRVLDLCCYSGGFALNAALGGATEVTGVDSSATAVALARQNAALNGVEGVATFHQAEAAAFMRQAAAEGQQYDLVVLDPPKLAPTRKSLARATYKYRKLNAAAMTLLPPGGLLMTCSCSGAMSQSRDFIPMLQAAAQEAGRRITVLRDAGAAADHTLDPAYIEGRYLTNVLVRVL